MKPEELGAYYESMLDKEVRKEGGIYYTPQYIANDIVKHTVGQLLKDKTPEEAARIKIVDPACGAGAFLLGAYQYLIVWYEKHFGKLTFEKKRRILIDNIFGVDIDPSAVEITKYCLSIKCSEGRDSSLDLDGNICYGNALADDVWHPEFADIVKNGGFDAIIGNPPYVKESANRKAFENVQWTPLSRYYQGKMDLCWFFICQGIDLLKENGLLGFIIPNNWTTNSGASVLRNKIVTESTIRRLCDFGNHKVFERSGIQTMILILEKSKREQYTFDYGRIALATPNINSAKSLLAGDQTEGLLYWRPTLIVEERKDSFLVFEEIETEKILKKIRTKKNFALDKNTEIAQGIVPNPDVVNAKNITKIPHEIRKQEKIEVGDGVFVVENDFFRRLTKTERKYIKPLYEPSRVRPYDIGESRKKIIYITKRNYKDDCPRIIEHLSRFKDIMAERRENKEKKLQYYHLHWGRAEEVFSQGPKILSVRKCAKPTFVYTEKEAFVMMAFNVIRSNRIDLKYLTAMLNSRLIAFWLRHRGKMQGLQYQVDKEPLLNIPLVDTDDKAVKRKIVKCVDELLQLYPRLKAASFMERSNVENSILYLENEINKLVYRLYGLTDAEIAVVEGSMKSSSAKCHR